MNRNEFNEKVKKSFEEYKSNMLKKSPEKIFEESYTNAKMVELRNYLVGSDDECVECLYPYAESILFVLDDYEMRYDVTMWCEWDNISDMIRDLVSDKENLLFF